MENIEVIPQDGWINHILLHDMKHISFAMRLWPHTLHGPCMHG